LDAARPEKIPMSLGRLTEKRVWSSAVAVKESGELAKLHLGKARSGPSRRTKRSKSPD
jgi:hypothetical protein